MPGFDDAWKAVAVPQGGEEVSAELRPLLETVYQQVLKAPLDRPGLKKSLAAVLVFLSSRGRTNANCWAVDLFLSLGEGWERDWTEQDLPEDFHEVLAKMGEALHDTVKGPGIAENFGCLPEQLLERLATVRTGS